LYLPSPRSNNTSKQSKLYPSLDTAVNKLTWRPLQFSASQDMTVQMVNRLPPIFACIYHNSVTFLTQLLSLAGALFQQSGNQTWVSEGNSIDIWVMLQGNNQEVNRRLGIDILYNHELFVLVY